MAMSVRFLKNHGVVIKHPPRSHARSRFVRPNGALSVPEAAAALRTNEMKLYRLIVIGNLKAIRLGAEKRVPLSEIRRLRADRMTLADRRQKARP